MRIGYLVTTYPTVSHTFIRRELREMERRGHSIVRIAIRSSQHPLVDPQDQEESARTLHCLSQPWWRILLGFLRTAISSPLALLSALFLALRLSRRSEAGLVRNLAYLVEGAYLKGVLDRQGVEHLHVHFGTNSASVGRIIRRLGGPPYSFTVHGPDEFDCPRSLDLKGKVEDAAFVAAVSDYTAAQIRRWSAWQDWPKVEVIRCTVDDRFFEHSPIDPGSHTLVCVGRLCPQKGQFLLLQAFAAVVQGGLDGKLVLAGDGEMRPLLERAIEDLQLSGLVEITGWIPEAEVRKQVLASRAMVLPSFAEGLPVAIMEGMALARPVISTYVAGIPELVYPGVNGWLVPAGSREALAAALEQALRLPVETLRSMGLKGRELVMQRHSVQGEGERLEKLFMGTRHGHAQPRPRQPVRSLVEGRPR